MKTFTLASILCVLVLSISSTSWAQTPVGIFPFQSVERTFSSRDLHVLSRKVLLQFDQNDLYRVVRKYPLTGGKAPVQTDPTLAEKRKKIRILNKFLGNAVKQMGNNAFERVIPLIKLGIKKAAASSKWPESFPILARMCGLWALAAFRLGRDDEGELLLKALARMNPKPAPPEIKANRQMAYRYKRALASTARQAKGSIKIIGTEGAVVYVDGKKAGKIPREIFGLPQGIHYVRVYKSGHFAWGSAMKVTANQSKTARVYLKAFPAPKRSNIDTAKDAVRTQVQLLELRNNAMKSASRKLCSHTQIQHLLTAQIKKKDSQYLLTPIRVNCKNGDVLHGKPLPINENFIDAELPIYRSMIQLIRKKKSTPAPRRIVANPFPGGRKTGPRAVIARRRTPPNQVKKGGIHTQWWFWTLISVGVAGGAAAGTAVYIMNQPTRIGTSATWALK